MTKMAGPDCAVMCINKYTHTQQCNGGLLLDIILFTLCDYIELFPTANIPT